MGYVVYNIRDRAQLVETTAFPRTRGRSVARWQMDIDRSALVLRDGCATPITVEALLNAWAIEFGSAGNLASCEWYCEHTLGALVLQGKWPRLHAAAIGVRLRSLGMTQAPRGAGRWAKLLPAGVRWRGYAFENASKGKARG